MLLAVTEPAVTVPAVIPVVAVITSEKLAVEPVIPPFAFIVFVKVFMPVQVLSPANITLYPSFDWSSTYFLFAS